MHLPNRSMLYEEGGPISSENYKKIKIAVNSKIKKRFHNKAIHFNTVSFVESLSSDGVHWNSEGKERVESKIITAIQ